MKKEQILFNEYIDWLNSYNSAFTTTSDNYPKLTYRKMANMERKQLIYRNIRARLLNIVLKLFKWKTPDTIDARTIEQGLILRGAACLYRDTLGTFMLPCNATNRLNIYGNPLTVRVYGWNGYNKNVKIKYLADIPSNMIDNQDEEADSEGIYLRDNDLTYPYINYILEYAYKLADKIVALEIATQRLKNPFIYVIRDINLKDTLEQLTNKIEANEDLIIRLKNDKMQEADESIKPIANNANPNIIMAIKDSINFDFNMFLETVGINTNPSPDKSQVVLTPELESNNSLIDIEKDVRYLNRVKFCEEAKKILNVDISVELNVHEAAQEIDKAKNEVGIENDTKQPKKISKKTE